MRIGIPKALLYYKYSPLWSTFLTELGQEVVVSSITNKNTLKEGVERAENEVCVPVKVFYGHIIELKDKVDALFIPRVVSTEEKTYTCPKFLGLPDMIRALDQELPPIMAPTFNLREGLKSYYHAFEELGKKFTPNRLKIFKAYLKAHQAHRRYHHQLLEGFILLDQEKSVHSSCPPLPAASGLARSPSLRGRRGAGRRVAGAAQFTVHSKNDLDTRHPTPDTRQFKIGVLGHPYNIYDPFISMNLIERLRKRGMKVLTSEMIPLKVVQREEATLPKRLFWSYEKDIIGTAFSWLRRRKVDGIIYVLSFACGPDSLIQVLIEQEAKKTTGIPLMPIVIDEHTAETGLITRLEAFLDMLTRRKTEDRSQTAETRKKSDI